MGAVDLKQASKFGVNYTIYTYKNNTIQLVFETTNFSILLQILMSSSLNNLHSRLDKREFLFHMNKNSQHILLGVPED